MKWIARLALAGTLICTLGAAPAPAAPPESSDFVAVVPPSSVLAGRVLMKDGVTPVRNATVLMTGALDNEARRARSDRAGRFTIKLPAGRYALQIERQMELYETRSTYRVPAGGGRLDIDFLLLPDFEKPRAGSDGRAPIAQGPAPRPDSPVVVGSVVDVVRSHAARRPGRWGEALGFLGSLLVVGLVAN